MQHKPKYSHRISNVTTDAVVISKERWKFVKREAVHKTASEEMELARKQDATKKLQEETVRIKRERLLDIDPAKQMQMKNRSSSQQVEEHERALRIAKAKENEELDEVKEMNALVMAARVRTIRDAEIKTKKQIRQREKEIDDQENRELEENRKRAVEIYKQREQMLKEQRVAGMKTLEDQIKQRAIARHEEEKFRQTEIEEMKKASKQADEAERNFQQEKKARQQAFMNECLEANKACRLRKLHEKELEQRETNSIVEYNKQQAAKAAEYEASIAAMKAQKEREINELRKQQQRVMDTRAEEDDLRAQRVQEEANRRERQREIDDLAKEVKAREDAEANRRQAALLRQRRLIQLARIEEEEFNQAREASRRQKEIDAAERARKQKVNEEYNQALQAEMNKRETERRLAPLVHIDEQHHLEEEREDYLLRFEEIRQAKVEMLRAEGIPDKYISELQNRHFAVK